MKRRVLILGGGCGGVATAWRLTRTPQLRERFDVTLVQAGWRLGGKGATGRDSARAHAVLEHGLHLWLGFYDAAFAMVADLYRDWDAPKTGPQRSIDAAFSPMHDVTLVGGTDHEREMWRMRFPSAAGKPWQRRRGPVSHVRLAATWAATVRSALVDEPGDRWTSDRIGVLAGLTAAIVKGLSVEMLRHGPNPWLQMDEIDFRDWLQSHGASAEQACAPPVGALYDLGFAYPDHVPRSDGGAAAAGVALKVMLNIFGGYRGAPFWRMNAGMGDTIFAPAYEVLRARGVNFRFFERLRHLSCDGGRVDAIELDVQATGTANYEPLVDVGDIRAWPAEPRRELLAELAEGDLEADCGPALGTRQLQCGADYDDVVLAIPATAHHHFATELIAADERYAQMVAHTHGVPTIAAQWWMARRPSQLGWKGVPGVLTGTRGMFRTWADLSEVVDAERWPERPASLAYFCNVAPPDVAAMSDRAAASRSVARKMQEWADTDVSGFWPHASLASGRFDQGALAALDGEDPWGTQYARANVADWERYILSLPGTTKYRLPPGDSGFENLYLAGDWTQNRVNGGSVEGAVTSGIAAADAIIR